MSWRIMLEGKELGSRDDIRFQLIDILKMNPRALRQAYVDELIKRVKTYPHYKLIENIKYFADAHGKQKYRNRVMLLEFIEKETNKEYAILFLRLGNKNILPIAVWPDKFAKMIAENFSVLQNYIKDIVLSPEKFSQVYMVLPLPPNKMPEELPDQFLWTAIFEGDLPGTEDDWTYEFIDVSGSKTTSKIYTDDILTNILKMTKTYSHYQIKPEIKQVISNVSGKKLIRTNCLILHVLDKSESTFVNLLFHAEKPNFNEIIGVWPQEVAGAFLKNKNVFDPLLKQLIQIPTQYKEVYIFLTVDYKDQIAEILSSL